MNVILKSLLLVMNLVSWCVSKKYILKTKPKPGNETYIEMLPNDRQYDDYMANVAIQNVDVGSQVTLRCNSPKNMSACFFSKKDSNLYYKIKPKASFQKKRLQCLCDVSTFK